uniref:YceD family protein n=1 Tax=Flavobacterium sp. TaxID=239 RepID=UPI00404B567B
MKNLKEYLIPFTGLKIGIHQFDYQVDNLFFEYFNFDEYNAVNVKMNVELNKKQTMLELVFSHKGFVNVYCDVTGEPFDLKIKGKSKLIVQFGDAFNNDDEALLVIPHNEFELDIAQYVYENIILSVPVKRIHPGIKDGTLKTEALDTLVKLSPKEENKENEDIDPRWENLKKLLTDK